MIDLRSALRGRPLVIAHRGASGEAPENSMAAFQLAIEQGADLIETDVHLTADGQLVAIHDHSLDRTTDGHGLVREHTLAQIKSLDSGAWFAPSFSGQKVLTLDELLAWAANRIPVAIEIKNGPIYYEGIEERVVETIRRHGMERSAMVISFDHAAVKRLKRLSGEVLGGVLFAGTPMRASNLAIEAEAEAILPNWASITPEMVADAHDRGLAVSTWVTDETAEMRWVLAHGVDAIATNRPGRLAALLQSQG
ncbi:MAG TPA: glycerophosphodiester phosphodiesterase [Chloroflexota bacterium]|nr:glycerophosphodiester phosphodiesterase [Chloroflexota bacterium]